MTKLLRDGLRKTPQFDGALLWFDACDFAVFSEFAAPGAMPAALFAAGSLLAMGDRRLPNHLPQYLSLSWPYALPGQEPPRLYRLRGWLAARRIPAAHETTALNTYLALDAVAHALVHAVDRYSREYLIESIEHEIENQLNPGVFARLSLGPGQRVAARGASILSPGRAAPHAFAGPSNRPRSPFLGCRR